MSNIFITDIVGTGTYAIPSNDAQLAAATAGFDTILGGIANLTYDRVLAWVEDQEGPNGAEGVRTLNCLVEKFTYLTKECPSETEVDTLGAAIEAALEADASITTVGQQQYHLFQAGAYFLWNRDASGGFLYPNTPTDDVAVGPFATPAGKWFDDGDLVLGGSTMSGAEKLKVVGAVLIDQDTNNLSLDIDSEATGSVLINLQPVLANTRGDIAFGVVRTADPSGPSEGDVWYNSTLGCLRYYNGVTNVCMSPGGFGNAFDYANDDSIQSTNSTTPVQVLRLSVTGVPAGDYLILLSYIWSKDGPDNQDFRAIMQIDDITTIYFHDQEPTVTNTSQNIPATFHRVETLTAGNHNIDFDFFVSKATSTAYVTLVTISLFKVTD